MQGFNERAASAVALAFLLAACRAPAPSAPPPPAVTAAPAIGRTRERVGRVHRPHRGGGLRRGPAARLGLHREGGVHRGQGGEAGRRALRHRPARVQGRARPGRGRADPGADPGRAGEERGRSAPSRSSPRTRSRARSTTRASAAAPRPTPRSRRAEAAVRTAKLNLEWTRVRAPISGRVSRAEVTAGNLVQGGAPDAHAAHHHRVAGSGLRLLRGRRAGLPALQPARPRRHAGRVRASRGTPCAWGSPTRPGYPHTGYVDFVDNQLNPNTGTIRARAVFTNKDRFFTPGLFARIQLLGSGKFDAVLVQDGAIGTDQDRKFVYVLKPDSTVEYRSVELGRIVDGLRVIRKGVAPGEEVVINGLQRIRPGMKVDADDHDHGIVRFRPDCAARLVMRFSRFFIDRPIFAAVLSIVILIAGILSMQTLPISEYPEVVPPSVVVTRGLSRRQPAGDRRDRGDAARGSGSTASRTCCTCRPRPPPTACSTSP